MLNFVISGRGGITLFYITVNLLYNDIRYYRKIRYNVNSVYTKVSGSCIFNCYSHVILQENIRFLYLLESPRRGDSNKYTKRVILTNTQNVLFIKNVQKYPLFML